MNSFLTTEKVHLEGSDFQEEGVAPENQKDQHSFSNTGLPIYQVFEKDELVKQTENMLVEEVSSSLWNKISSWWRSSEKNPNLPDPTSQPTERVIKEKLSPINLIPAIDPPENISLDLQGKLSSILKKTASQPTLTPTDIARGLAVMSEHTIEAIMAVIFKTQIELEKENANIAEKTFSKYLDFQKMQQKVLQEIKEILEKDENVANHLQTAQKITLVASFISGIAMAAMSFGLLGHVGRFIGDTVGRQAAATFMFIASSLGTIGPSMSAGLTGLTMGTKSYFQSRTNEHKAKHEEYEYKDRYYNDCVENSRNRLVTTAETDSVFKEHWIRFLRRLDKMRKIVFKK